MNREATGLAGVRHIVYETLGSTNAEALARARAGERGPLWITRARPRAPAAAGAAAPGCRRRAISTRRLLLTEPSPPAQAPQLSFVAALALHDAVASCAPQLGPSLKLKWPNDLLLGRRQARRHSDRRRERAGLCRRDRHRRQLRCASVRHAYPATDLAAAGAVVAPEALLAALAAAMQRRV